MPVSVYSSTNARSVEHLDLFTLPLTGVRLIEASAGTGKTYTLAGLYLRLLLGLGNENAFPRSLGVDEILVVTFTDAATEELRARIRSNIHGLRLACLAEESDHPLYERLLEEIENYSLAAKILLLAERRMDEAAIYTIHGFCQRMLKLHALASGRLFQLTLVTDEAELSLQATTDFWRHFCYGLSEDMAKAVLAIWRTPNRLYYDIKPYLQRDTWCHDHATPSFEVILASHQRWLAEIDQFKQMWLEYVGYFQSIITDSGVSKQSYSKRNLPEWLEQVTFWAQQPTQDYTIAKALTHFSQKTLCDKTKKGEAPMHPVFLAVDDLLAQSFDLRSLIFPVALQDVRLRIAQEKQRRAEFGYHDLLVYLSQALSSPQSEQLAEQIRQLYPIALIDEFQDTDPEQYHIFRTLYYQQPEHGLLLIGDPKQAIYSFRGADIFTYIQAKQGVDSHHTLTTNWRSSPSMVAAINSLFSLNKKPFVFDLIDYYDVDSPKKHASLALTIHGETQSPLMFSVFNQENVSVTHYQDGMAQHCAQQICDLLQQGQRQEALLHRQGEDHPIKAADIAVLVRTRHEAELIRQALAQRSIPSVYLSNRESVFTTQEARDILWLLQAVQLPQHERRVKTALATQLFGLSAQEIDEVIHDELAWDEIIAEFLAYQQCWRSRGVLPMLRQFMTKRRIAERLLAGYQGERRLTDLMHLSELLQQASDRVESDYALVRWLSQQIMQPNPDAENQQLRLESDEHVIQIVTIHKSKGLEYPIVFLPFAGFYRQQKEAFYHNRETFQTTLDLTGDEQALALADEERLAEDVRILYVALTRAIYYCWVGLAPLVFGRKSGAGSDLHRTAIGYLVQNGQAGDLAYLQQQLTSLMSAHIGYREMDPHLLVSWEPSGIDVQKLSAKAIHRHDYYRWSITSYSGLQQHSSHSVMNYIPNLDVDVITEQGTIAQSDFSIHQFAKGAAAGTFLHTLFEKADFSCPISEGVVAEVMVSFGIDEHWLAPLHQWLNEVMHVPLNAEGLSLSCLLPSHKLVEFGFYVPISKPLCAAKLSQLIQHYDPLSVSLPELAFAEVEGMLKGYIDLVFVWQGRYYIVDYKSNWLGEDEQAYNQEALVDAMQQHRYDLQYQLYCLALHRYLRHRLVDYDYERHFGGVYYLFLRGLVASQPKQGVFYCRPTYAFIGALDQLFSGEHEGDENATSCSS